MILGDILLCRISWSAHRQSTLTKKLPMSGSLGGLVQKVEKFEVHAEDLG